MLFFLGLLALSRTLALLTLMRIEHDATLVLLGRFLSFLLASSHGLVTPFVGRLNEICASLSIVASHVTGFAAIEQIHICHGVIVVFPLIDGRLEHFHAFINCGAVFRLKLVTPFLTAFSL